MTARAPAQTTPGDKRRILYMVDYTDLGGGETSLLHLLDQLRLQTPHLEPFVIVAGPGALAQALRERGIAHEIFPYPRRLRYGPLPWFDPAAALRLDRLIARLRPVLIHAIHFFGLFYAGPAARRQGVPLVWTCHGWYDVDTWPKRRIARMFADRILCVSEAVREEAVRRLGRPEIITGDPLGIPPFEPGGDATRAGIRRELGVQPHHRPLAAVVGRFQPIKGHALLLDALPELRRRVPGLLVWLIGDALYGSAEEAAHKALLMRRIHQEGLGDCVQCLGYRHDARRLMRALDALMIPSERESFSMVAVEGLEAGVPVIGPDGWGPREIVDVPRTGLLFEPGNARDLTERAAQALLRQDEGAKFDADAGPRRVRLMFSARAHLERTLACYRTLAGAALDPPRS
jgi:glycosyltransferase involved in cell wall biosynthesis